MPTKRPVKRATKRPAKPAPAKARTRKPKPAPPEAPPAVNWATCPVAVTFTATEFPVVVRNAALGASTDPLRPPLNCASIEMRPDARWRVVTTDSYKIVVQDGPYPAAGDGQAIVAEPWQRLVDVSLLVRALQFVGPAIRPQNLGRGKTTGGADVAITWPNPDQAYLKVVGDDDVRLPLRGALTRRAAYPDFTPILDGLVPTEAYPDVPPLPKPSRGRTPQVDVHAAARKAHADRLLAAGQVRPVQVSLNVKFLGHLSRLRPLDLAGGRGDDASIRIAPDWSAVKPVRFDVQRGARSTRVWGAIMPVRVA